MSKRKYKLRYAVMAEVNFYAKNDKNAKVKAIGVLIKNGGFKVNRLISIKDCRIVPFNREMT